MSGKLSAEVARHFVGDPTKLREFYAGDEELVAFNFSVYHERNRKFRETADYKQMQATLSYVSSRCSAFVFPRGVDPDEVKVAIDARNFILPFDQTKDGLYSVGVRPYGFEVVPLLEPLPDLVRKLADVDVVYADNNGYDELCKNLEGGNGHATIFYFDPRQVRILRNTDTKEKPRWVPVEAPDTPQYRYFM